MKEKEIPAEEAAPAKTAKAPSPKRVKNEAKPASKKQEPKAENKREKVCFVFLIKPVLYK